MKAILKMIDVFKCHNGVNILDGINLTVDEGEFIAIMGPSQTEKTTLLYNMCGLDTATSGRVYYENTELTAMDSEDVSELRLNKMGIIFQRSYLLKSLSIQDNIKFPGVKSNVILQEQVDENAEKLLTLTGIADIKSRSIQEVTDSQLQRAAICRALVNDPNIIFGDEVTRALDSDSAEAVMDILAKVNASGKTVIITTTDPKVAKRASRVLYLNQGTIQGEF